MDLVNLKEFVDLGGVFILALVLVWVMIKKLDQIDSRLIKLLTLITVLLKKQTDFNHVDKILGKDEKKIKEALNDSGSELGLK